VKISTVYQKFPWFELLIAIALFSVNLYAAGSDAFRFPNTWFTRDDAYYYFKVAQNIAGGLGSTFDGLNLTNGYHPLWMLLCIPIFSLARIDVVLPLRILLVLLAGFRIATSLLMYHMLKSTIARPVAMLAALYWAFDYRLHTTIYQQGLETPLAVFSLVLFLFVMQRVEAARRSNEFSLKQIFLLSLYATLFVFSRLDLVFLAVIFGFWFVFRNLPFRTLLLFDLLILTSSLAGAFIFRVGFPDFYEYKGLMLTILTFSLALKVSFFMVFGLYTRVDNISLSDLVRGTIMASAASAVVLFIGILILNRLGWLQGNFPRSVPIIDMGLTVVLVLFIRIGYRIWRVRQNDKASIVPLSQEQLKSWARGGLVYFGLLGSTLGGYMIWNRLTFGTFTPVSGQIKRWWGSFPSKVYGGSARSALAFFGIEPEGDFNAWSPVTSITGDWHRQIEMRTIPIDYDLRYALMLLLIALGLGTVLYLINRQRTIYLTQKLALVPLFVGAEIQVLSYNLTGYSALKEWYWVTQLVFIVLVGGMAIDVLTRPLRRLRPGNALLTILVLYWGFNSGASSSRIIIANMLKPVETQGKPLMEAAAFIEKYTEPGSLVGMTGGGNVGYFIHDRTIINMDGLINSYPYFLAHRAKNGGTYLAEIGMQYIFANPDFLDGLPYRGEYTNQLEVIDYFGGKAIMRFNPLVER